MRMRAPYAKQKDIGLRGWMTTSFVWIAVVIDCIAVGLPHWLHKKVAAAHVAYYYSCCGFIQLVVSFIVNDMEPVKV